MISITQGGKTGSTTNDYFVNCQNPLPILFNGFLFIFVRLFFVLSSKSLWKRSYVYYKSKMTRIWNVVRIKERSGDWRDIPDEWQKTTRTENYGLLWLIKCRQYFTKTRVSWVSIPKKELIRHLRNDKYFVKSKIKTISNQIH